MKYIICLLCLIIIAAHADVDLFVYALADAKKLFAAYDVSDNAIIDNGAGLLQQGFLTKATALLKEDLSGVLKKMPSMSEVDRAFLIVAARGLSDEQYVAFARGCVDMCRKKQIGIDQLEWTVLPAGSEKLKVMEDRNNLRAMATLREARSLFTEKRLINWIDRIIK